LLAICRIIHCQFLPPLSGTIVEEATVILTEAAYSGSSSSLLLTNAASRRTPCAYLPAGHTAIVKSGLLPRMTKSARRPPHFISVNWPYRAFCSAVCRGRSGLGNRPQTRPDMQNEKPDPSLLGLPTMPGWPAMHITCTSCYSVFQPVRLAFTSVVQSSGGLPRLSIRWNTA